MCNHSHPIVLSWICGRSKIDILTRIEEKILQASPQNLERTGLYNLCAFSECSVKKKKKKKKKNYFQSKCVTEQKKKYS